jgi:benzoyl-CoA reductase/2-hydroxyglutaryl-CoA dehydratase subunit BcrC/BadD/HgdB
MEAADFPQFARFADLAGPMENPYVEEWKAGGGRVAGFFCAHAPEELLWAAGFLPLRMRGTGSDDTSFADQYLGPANCSFVRHTLNRVLEGDLAFLDGLLVTNSCDHIRRLYDIFNAKKAAPFCHYVDVPHVKTPDSLERLAQELRGLKQRLESSFGVTISQEKLAEAIVLYNRTRKLLSRASDLRAEDPPRAAGSEVLAMSVAAASMPKDRFNPLLEERLAKLEAGAGDAGAKGPRLLILGGILDDPGFLETIESMGATIAADQLCCSAKTFSNLADESIDPIEAIARRMLERMSCPRMLDDYPKRLADVLEAAKRHRIDGVICERLKFCDLWGGEIEMLRRSLREQTQIPVLVLERDYLSAGGMGQIRTRVQAFLEGLA